MFFTGKILSRMKKYTSVGKLLSLGRNGIPFGKIMTMVKNV